MFALLEYLNAFLYPLSSSTKVHKCFRNKNYESLFNLFSFHFDNLADNLFINQIYMILHSKLKTSSPKIYEWEPLRTELVGWKSTKYPPS